MSIADTIRKVSKMLPPGLARKARGIVDGLPRQKIDELLGEVREAARAAKDAEERRASVDRLLRRIAATAGVELSGFELKLLRHLVVKLVLRS